MTEKLKTSQDAPPTPQDIEGQANIFSKLTFEWLTPLLWRGFRKPLEHEDLPALSKINRADKNIADFDHYWQLHQHQSKPLLRTITHMFWFRWTLCAIYWTLYTATLVGLPSLVYSLVTYIVDVQSDAMPPSVGKGIAFSFGLLPLWL